MSHFFIKKFKSTTSNKVFWGVFHKVDGLGSSQTRFLMWREIWEYPDIKRKFLEYKNNQEQYFTFNDYVDNDNYFNNRTLRIL